MNENEIIVIYRGVAGRILVSDYCLDFYAAAEWEFSHVLTDIVATADELGR